VMRVVDDRLVAEALEAERHVILAVDALPLCASDYLRSPGVTVSVSGPVAPSRSS
jgi:hypothetical protein